MLSKERTGAYYVTTLAITNPATGRHISISYVCTRGENGKHIGFKLRRLGIRVRLPSGARACGGMVDAIGSEPVEEIHTSSTLVTRIMYP